MSMILGREHNKNRPFCADDYTSAKIVQNFDYAKKKQIKFQTNEIFFIIITRGHLTRFINFENFGKNGQINFEETEKNIIFAPES